MTKANYGMTSMPYKLINGSLEYTVNESIVI